MASTGKRGHEIILSMSVDRCLTGKNETEYRARNPKETETSIFINTFKIYLKQLLERKEFI